MKSQRMITGAMLAASCGGVVGSALELTARLPSTPKKRTVKKKNTAAFALVPHTVRALLGS